MKVEYFAPYHIEYPLILRLFYPTRIKAINCPIQLHQSPTTTPHFQPAGGEVKPSATGIVPRSRADRNGFMVRPLGLVSLMDGTVMGYFV
eukprot:scaffold1290_cov112-Skeletonema_dohrnii-CCMP3373.AAC.4